MFGIEEKVLIMFSDEATLETEMDWNILLDILSSSHVARKSFQRKMKNCEIIIHHVIRTITFIINVLFYF